MTPGLLAIALAAAVSSSKLGVVVVGDLGSTSTPASQILAACPRLVVFPVNAGNRALVAAQVVAYKQSCIGGKAVLQVGGRGLPVNAATAAALWYQEWFPLVLGIEADGVEGPWDVTGKLPDQAAFWGQFALVVNASTYLPIIGSFAPGLPAGIGTANDAFCEPVAQARSAGVSRFAVSFRVRAAPIVTTSDAALVFRQVATDCSLAGVPLFVTEVTPATGQWTQADMTWLDWFAGQVATSDVVGVAAFALGTTGPLDLSAIATQFIAHLGGSGGGGGGGTPGGGGGGTVTPSPAGTGELSPPSKQGCSTGGPAFSALALLPLLLRRRRFRA